MRSVTKSEVAAAAAADRSDDLAYISPIEDILEEARRGRMFVLVDDEDRENEGDLVIPAQWATAEVVNFMARYGRGLICLAMDAANIERLGLPLMAQQNASRHQTAFTVSIEAREGVTTGISAADRALTIQVAINPESGPRDIATPGHVFPLLARDGGVLVRAGHTEAAVDIARMAGLIPAGVICEIMNDDGTMARLPDLVKFAQFHGLKIGTIADLISYRRRTETIVERTLETELHSRHGGSFRMHVYVNKVAYAEHIALVKGDIAGPEPVLVRMHALNVLEDVLHETRSGRGGELQAAMERIGEAGRGAAARAPGDQPVEPRQGHAGGVRERRHRAARLRRRRADPRRSRRAEHGPAVEPAAGHHRARRLRPARRRPPAHRHRSRGGGLMPERPNILIVEARFYGDIADEMAKGAIAALEEAGAAWKRIAVPGAFEIPAAIGFAHRAAEAGRGERFDGFVALGCVIRGETTHYDYVCLESARGLQDLALREGLAIGYGIITVENDEQAWARARRERKDKGGGAARACLDMVRLKAQFGLTSS